MQACQELQRALSASEAKEAELQDKYEQIQVRTGFVEGEERMGERFGKVAGGMGVEECGRGQTGC